MTHETGDWLGYVLRRKSITNDVLNWTPRGRRFEHPSRVNKVKKELRQLRIDNVHEVVLDGNGWEKICFTAIVSMAPEAERRRIIQASRSSFEVDIL